MIVAVALILGSAAFVALAVLSAPMGWQDDAGFHLGEPPDDSP